MNIEITNNPELKFSSLTDEQYHVYVFGDQLVRLDNPTVLNVSASGGHRVLDSEGISHYIPKGWIHLYWKVKDGQPCFAF